MLVSLTNVHLLVSTLLSGYKTAGIYTLFIKRIRFVMKRNRAKFKTNKLVFVSKKLLDNSDIALINDFLGEKRTIASLTPEMSLFNLGTSTLSTLKTVI